MIGQGTCFFCAWLGPVTKGTLAHRLRICEYRHLMGKFDVVIAGAGIAGASAAYELSRTRRVLVLEQESQPGYHTTGRSAALFIDFYGNEAVRALTAASKEFFFTPPDGFAEVPLVRTREAFLVATRDQAAALNAVVDEFARTGLQLPVDNGYEIEARVPLLRPGLVQAAVHDPGAQDINVDALLQGFLRGASGRGTELLTGAEITAVHRQGAQWIVDSTAGRFETPVLVNAAGAWAGRIAELAGAASVLLRPLRRSMLVLDSRDTKKIAGIGRWPLVADVGEQWYFKPEAGQLLWSPSEEDEIDACDAVADDMVIAQAVDRLERVLDLQVRHTPRSWAGLRTFADDRSPVVGYDPGLEGFFWLAGQGGFGIQTAPAMGRIAAALIAGSDLPGDMRKLGLLEDHIAPARFFTDN